MGKLGDSSFSQLIPTGAKVVVGLSGGADSVALLDLLQKQGYDCVAAHCNFHLRGEESNRDFKFAHSQSIVRKIPFYHIDFQTDAYAKIRRISTEMAARELRYQWFEELKERVKADYVAVAHHADDCIETFMINLSRGTGLKGLSGIKAKQAHIVRPLLRYTKQDILEYIRENHLEYVDDSTNFESVYTRNKFRNNILPLMEEASPSFRKSVLLTMDHLAEVENFVNNQIDALRQQVLKPSCSGGFSLAKRTILERSDAHFVLFELLRPFCFAAEIIDDLLRLGMGGSGKHFFSDHYELRVEREFWEILPIQKSTDEKYLIQTPDDLQNLPIRLRINKFKADELLLRRDAKVCYADCDKIQFPLVLRHCLSGDYFVPFGMTGRKKTSDFFIDQHYSQFDKMQTWLLTSVNGEAIWLVAKRADNRCRITEKTAWVYEFTIE